MNSTTTTRGLTSTALVDHPDSAHRARRTSGGWIRRAYRIACLVAVAFTLPASSLAQSQTRPASPSAWNDRLEIGPVAGLTTDWHRAPHDTGVPLGTTVRLRVRAPSVAQVRWTGAREIERDLGGSLAEVVVLDSRPRTVAVEVEGTRGSSFEESVTLRGVDLATDPLRISQVHVVEEELHLDPGNLNAVTMAHYFGDPSVAAVRRISDRLYRTSVQRWIVAAASVTPSSLAPMLEWKLDGHPQAATGERIALRSFTSGTHSLSAGEAGPGIDLEIYRVRITGPDPRDGVPEYRAVTYTAATVPPGYEEDVTWLASTKYGDCDPLTGTGPTFTVRFGGTFGADGRWLGVRADNAAAGLDDKQGAFPFPAASELKQELEAAFVSEGTALSISSCDPPCPKQICCADGSCVSTVSACGASFGLATESLALSCSDDRLTAGMVIDGFDLTSFQNGRDVGLAYLKLPQVGDADDLPPGFYRLRIEESESNAGELTARFIDSDGVTRAEVPAEITVGEEPPSTSLLDFLDLCDFSFEHGFGDGGRFQVCAVASCGLSGLRVKVRACLTLSIQVVPG